MLTNNVYSAPPGFESAVHLLFYAKPVRLSSSYLRHFTGGRAVTREAHDTVAHILSALCSLGRRLTKVSDYYLNSSLPKSKQCSQVQTF